jgi:hypothetical protein
MPAGLIAMRRDYCDDCRAARPFQPAFGWGTFFAVLFTVGVWLVALPFYPLRCRECGRPWKPKVEVSRKPESPATVGRPRLADPRGPTRGHHLRGRVRHRHGQVPVVGGRTVGELDARGRRLRAALVRDSAPELRLMHDWLDT